MRTLRFTAESIYDLLKGDEVWIGEVPYFVQKSARGGMGFVLFLMRDDSRYQRTLSNLGDVHGLYVAIKTVLQANDSPTICQLFHRELTVWAGLDHPNIVNLNEILETPKDGWVAAMEGCTGSLQQYLADHGKLAPNDAIFILHDVVAGSHYAMREHNIFHLDLKPANILFDHNVARSVESKKDTACYYLWLVSDWGLAAVESSLLAKATDHALRGQDFETFNNVGTEGYMAPERYISGVESSISSDVFSLGIILFEMLTGVLPYESGAISLVDQVISQSYMTIAKGRLAKEHIPSSLADLTLRMIEPEASRRFQDYDELRHNLKQAFRRSNSFFARIFKF